ncbi:MAG: hypothetical protein RM022_033065 [Nostoc sp. EfeVER01]|uniref:hypothetical protein n=1 Tax=Nostoc sp. EfeVER01 TaxID=3075406 RepID=UPI003919A6D7
MNLTIVSTLLTGYAVRDDLYIGFPKSKQLLTNRRRSGVIAAACNNLGGSTSGFVAVADTAYLSEAVKSCAIT